ncbi:MAG: autotransporter domain-containing protein [Rhodospirillaceae bacterium]|nr:autotransporter domain-containing protein [Rhodospirillaceae bacterium]
MGGQHKIGSYLKLALLASAAATLSAPVSNAGDLSITNNRTTLADTATGDGAGPGNITVQSTGSVGVAGDAAVVINSNHSLTNLGSISNSQQQLATGVIVLTTQNNVANNITGNLTNSGSISVLGPPSNGPLTNLDVFNIGIAVSGLGTFTGNVINGTTNADGSVTGGTLTVGGASSFGILASTTMTGNLTNAGLISMTGAKNIGIVTTGLITGNITQSGTITAGGMDSIGMYIGGGVNGTITHSGGISVGTGSRLTSTNGVTLTTLDPIPAKSGIWLASNVTQGLLMTGNRITLTNEALDPTAAAAATPVDSNISVVGGGPGLLIGQGGIQTAPANITIGVGPNNGGFSVKNQGNILVAGSLKDIAASAITVQGLTAGGVNYTTTLTGGIWNDKGNIQSAARDAQAAGINIGNFGSVSQILNDGDILVSTEDSTSNVITGALGTKGANAYGVLVDTLGTLGGFTNTGNVIINSQGPTASAFGILDRSGTLTNFANSGIIRASVQTGSTGQSTAVDFSANTAGLTFANTGTITGNVFLGAGNTAVGISGANSLVTGNITFQNGATKAGNNTFTMSGGAVTGLVSLGNGSHTVSLTNGANVSRVGMGTGTMALTVNNSNMGIISSNPLTVSSALITGTSTITFDVNNASAQLPAVMQGGPVTFGAGTKVTAAFTGIIDGAQVITVVRSSALTFGAPLDQIVVNPNSFINAATFSLSAADPNTLLLTARRKSATELGLGANTSAFYNAFVPAVNQDVPVITAISALQTKETFEAGVRQLMPDSSGATLQASINNQDMSQGSIRRRLIGVAKNGMPDHAAGDIASFWAQAIGDYGDQKGKGEQAGFDIWGLGIAIGADAPILDRTTLVGISFSETWHSINLKESAQSPIQFYDSQANVYARYNNDMFYVQAVGGFGYNRYNQTRNVRIGSLSRVTVGKWQGYEYGGSVESGYGLKLDSYQLTPYVRGSYMKVHENGYTESGGGAGVDLTVAARNADVARGTAGFTLDRNFPIYYDSYVEAQLRGSFTREFMNDPYAVTAQFVAAGPSFTTFSNKRAPNRAQVGFGIAHKDSYSSVSLDYDAQIANGYMGHIVAITARFRF